MGATCNNVRSEAVKAVVLSSLMQSFSFGIAQSLN